MENKKGLIYLAAPYTHEDEAVMEDRFNRINKVAAKLMERGHFIYSPISHTHPIAKVGNLPRHFEYWKDYDELIISKCIKILVLILEGWEKSKGVYSEIKIANRFDIPYEYIDENLTIHVIKD